MKYLLICMIMPLMACGGLKSDLKDKIEACRIARDFLEPNNCAIDIVTFYYLLGMECAYRDSLELVKDYE